MTVLFIGSCSVHDSEAKFSCHWGINHNTKMIWDSDKGWSGKLYATAKSDCIFFIAQKKLPRNNSYKFQIWWDERTKIHTLYDGPKKLSEHSTQIQAVIAAFIWILENEYLKKEEL
jgi:hypothetical protein